MSIISKHSPSSISTYRTLVTKVTKELDDLEFLIKRSTAEAYWRVGKYIHEHFLEHRERADYGKQLLVRLAKDTGRDKSTLFRVLKFYRTYPIVAPGRLLSWGHYRTLMTVENKVERKRLENEIVRKKWDTHDVQKYLNTKRKLTQTIDVTPLSFSPGRLHTYRVVKSNACLSGRQAAFAQKGALALDMGFRVQGVLPPGVKWEEGDTAELLFKDGALTGAAKTEAEGRELFTYLGVVDRVVDGDTLLVSFDLGLNFSISQKLRLAGVDCAELDTEEGRAAKRFVESILKGVSPVIVKTVKDRTDRYDRYLAEVFLGTGQSRANFLNQMLLDERLAVKYV